MTQIGVTARQIPRTGAFNFLAVTIRGKAEVDDVHPPEAVDDEIVGLDIAVGDAERVKIGERFPHVACHAQRQIATFGGTRSRTEHLPDGLSFHPRQRDGASTQRGVVLHHPRRIAFDAQPTDIDELRQKWRQRQRRMRSFASEPASRTLLSTDLEGHERTAAKVASLPDISEASTPRAREDLEPGPL
jgi:hypothetical protein